MASIQTMIALSDRVSAPLYSICTAIEATIGGFESMQYASGTAFDVSAFDGARENLAAAATQLQAITDGTGQAVNKQEEYNKKVGEGSVSANKLLGTVKAFIGAYIGLSGIKNVLGVSDESTQTNARLGMMVTHYNVINGSMQTTAELSQMIFQSAQDSRASYTDMAAAVAKLGNNVRDAFSSTEEVVGFAELVNKQFTIAGASASESSNAFLQLTQALGSGVLRGDELNSIFEQAPNLIQTIADYMGEPVGAIRELASEGQITADIVKNAMFAAQDEINAKFEKMPMTWEQLATSFQNQALMIFQSFLQRLNEFANSTQIQTVITGVMGALSSVAMIALSVIDVLAAGGAFIVDNWSVIAPIIGGVAIALGGYVIALGIYNTVQAVSNGLKEIAAIKERVHTAALAIQSGATFGATAAQYGFNAALLACPLTWIVLAIIAVIAAIYLIVAAINKVTDETYSATGVIAGAFFALGAILLNTVIGVINAIIQVIWAMFVEPFLGIIEWVLNVVDGGFDSFGAAVANLIGQIISWFLSLGKVVTKIIDAIFGTNWTAGLSSLQDSVLAWGKTDDAITLDRSAPTINYRADVTDAYGSGYDWGQGVEDKVKDFFGGTGDESTDSLAEDLLGGLGDYGGYGGGGGAAENLSNIANDTSNISDSLDVSQEDVKYLRDIAEQEAINRFTTADINVNMSGMQNVVNNTNDLDGIVDGLTTRVISAMEVVRAGL